MRLSLTVTAPSTHAHAAGEDEIGRQDAGDRLRRDVGDEAGQPAECRAEWCYEWQERSGELATEAARGALSAERTSVSGKTVVLGPPP